MIFCIYSEVNRPFKQLAKCKNTFTFTLGASELLSSSVLVPYFGSAPGWHVHIFRFSPMVRPLPASRSLPSNTHNSGLDALLR